MSRFLVLMRTRAGWCLSLLLTGFALHGAQPVTNTQAATAASADATPLRLSLADAQRTAFQRNWDLLAAKSGIDSATAQLLVVKEFPNPTFSFSTADIDPHGNGTPLGNGLWNRSYDTIFAISQL